MRLFALLAAGLLVSLGAEAKESTATLKVSGWHCGGCANKTQAKLSGKTGVKSVKAEKTGEAMGTVTVTFDDEKTKIAEIEKTITDELHYKVEK